MTMLELAERLGNAGFRWLVEACTRTPDAPIDDPSVAGPAGAVRDRGRRAPGAVPQLVDRVEAGTAGPADASIVKLYYSELLQRMTDFGAEIVGLAGHTVLREAHLERMGVGGVGARLHRLVGVDDPRRFERDPADDHRRTRPRPAPRTERGLMTHEFADLHDELRAVARDLLAKDGEVGWPLLVDAGWLGLEVPDELDGAGATFAEVAVVFEEMGRAASTNSYLGSAVLAVGVLNALQPSDIRDALLSDVASGTGQSRRCTRAI